MLLMLNFRFSLTAQLYKCRKIW